jgi:protein ImuB
LARAVRELIDELAARLAAEGLGTLHLRLEVHRAGLQALSLSTRFSLPTASPEHWWSMLRHVLEGVHLGYGVEALCLKAEVVRAITAEQGVLPAMTSGGDQPWKAQQLEHARAELIDHLVQRLGHEAVRVPVERDTWVPERALAFHPVLEVGSAGRTTTPAPRPCHADRPLRLLQRPEPLCGNPLRQGFVWRGRTRTPTRRIGPERITLPWWESQPDRPPVIRDYYKVMDTEHRWWWLFRRVGEGDWWLHGLWN